MGKEPFNLNLSQKQKNMSLTKTSALRSGRGSFWSIAVLLSSLVAVAWCGHTVMGVVKAVSQEEKALVSESKIDHVFGTSETTPIGKSVWTVLPFEHTKHVEFIPGTSTDAFNPFHNYFYHLWAGKKADFPSLPLWHTWPHYFEAYHNHMH